jgi:phage shock protein PspC (stress-responsive transcriptional regulator)
MRRGSGGAGDSGNLLGVALALIHFSTSVGQTLALLATFLGIGVLVNLLIVYIVLQVMAERKQNQERQQLNR